MKKSLNLLLLLLTISTMLISLALPIFAKLPEVEAVRIEIKSAKSTGGVASAMSADVSKQGWGWPSSTRKNYIFDEKSNSFSILSATSSDIIVSTYDKTNFSLLESKNIPYVLNEFGGFYANKNYNFIVFGQDNPNEDDSLITYMVVKYSKAWVELGRAKYFNNNTVDTFGFGSLDMAEYDGYLYVHSAHTMYKSSDGANHQSNITFNIKIDNMTIIDDACKVSYLSYAYMSHSFDQFILFDNGKLVTVDRGDAYPRSIQLVQSQFTPINGRFIPRNDREYFYDFPKKSIDLFKIPGKIGAQSTGVIVGGVEASKDNYLVAINTVDHSKVTEYTAFEMIGLDRDERDIVLLVSDKDNTDTNNVKQVYFTDYVDNGKLGSTPYLVKLSDNRFVLLWEEFNYSSKNTCTSNGVKFVFIDGNGNALTKIRHDTSASLAADCQPILMNGKILWYVNKNSNTRTFYLINVCNHLGETEVRGAFAATSDKDGYTGDIYCKDCDEKISSGTVIPAIGISLNKANVKLNVGETFKLVATVTLPNITNKKVTWSSSDTSVVKVSDGVIKAVGVGEATITVKTITGEKIVKCNVTVIDPSLFKVGDLNGDGNIAIADLVCFAQFLANWDIGILESASDCDGDGSVTISDLVRLAQYLANWDVELVTK